MKKLTLVLAGVLVLISISGKANAQVEFSDDVTMVSTYVWRGVKQYNGPALQGTASFKLGAMSFGVWATSIDFGDDIEIESDPFVELTLPTGALESSIGATIYTYDFFETFNNDADFEYEVFAKIGVGPIGLAGYFVPSQASTKKNLNESDYWLEASTSCKLSSTELAMMFGYGTYSSKWLSEAKKNGVGNLVLTASRSLTEALTVSYNYSFGLDNQMENVLFLALGYSY